MPLVRQLKLKEIDTAYFLCKSALLLFFISDACNKLLLYLHYDFYRVSILFRSLYEILFFSLILLFINETRLLFLKIFLIVFTLFLSGQIIFALNVNYKYNFIENIFQFNKYFFVFIIYFAIYKLQNFSNEFQRITKLLENIFLFNSGIIIIGFIFQIRFLQTYIDVNYRHGYDGFIPAQNEATLFYFIAVAYFYYQHFILKIKSKKFIFILASSLLLGTKGIYLFLSTLLIFHFLYHSSLKTKLISMIIILILIFGGMWYLNTDHAKFYLSYFIFSIQKDGWLNMIMSGRNSLADTRGSAILDNWNIINYFIGGQDQTKFAIEMDFFDLFFFFGIIGGIIFIALYFSTLFRFNILKPFNSFFVLSFALIAFFAGHFLYSAINALYLCLVSLYLYQTQQRVIAVKNDIA